MRRAFNGLKTPWSTKGKKNPFLRKKKAVNKLVIKKCLCRQPWGANAHRPWCGCWNCACGGKGSSGRRHTEEGSGAVGRIMVFMLFSEAFTYRKSPRLYFLYWRRPKCSQAETWFRSLVMSLLLITFVGKEWGPHSKYPHSQLPNYYYTGCLRDWDKWGPEWASFPDHCHLLFPHPSSQTEERERLLVWLPIEMKGGW